MSVHTATFNEFETVGERVISARRAISESFVGSGYGLDPESEVLETLRSAVVHGGEVGLPLAILFDDRKTGKKYILRSSTDPCCVRLILLRRVGERVGAFAPRRDGNEKSEMPCLFADAKEGGFTAPASVGYGAGLRKFIGSISIGSSVGDFGEIVLE